jgi:hypothetical protein
MFQLAHKKEPARTTQTPTAIVWYQFLSSGPEDCEPLVGPEDFGKGGVEVEFEYVLSAGPEDCELSVDREAFGRGGVGVDSEYGLELRISGNMGRLGMMLTALKTECW